MKILITGGAGFIGSNVAAKHILAGDDVVIFDDLSREGSEKNLTWLYTIGNLGQFAFQKGTIDSALELRSVFLRHGPFDVIFHLAAQVAVTSSVDNPMFDFVINAYGTLVLLEEARKQKNDPIFIYSSTNKVYGDLTSCGWIEENTRYRYSSRVAITEDQPLDFHSPYGCSKGCADQYVRDFARIYNMRTVVLRQSCIYGPRQFGIVDQGWLSYFIISLLNKKPIIIYGDGKQVRDVLHINDLLVCFDNVIKNIAVAAGKVYNIGGGGDKTLSILEFFDLIYHLVDYKIQPIYKEARKGDQKIYISDITQAKNDLSWSPNIKPEEGIFDLYKWIKENVCS